MYNVTFNESPNAMLVAQVYYLIPYNHSKITSSKEQRYTVNINTFINVGQVYQQSKVHTFWIKESIFYFEFFSYNPEAITVTGGEWNWWKMPLWLLINSYFEMASKLPWKYKSLIVRVNTCRDSEEDINQAKRKKKRKAAVHCKVLNC